MAGLGGSDWKGITTWVRSGEKRLEEGGVRAKLLGLEHVAQSRELVTGQTAQPRLQATGEGG